LRDVVWASYARTQYLAAIAYLTERNEAAAEKLVERVEVTVQELAERPIGRPGYAADTFEKIVLKTSYVIVYELCGDELRVLRLFHMSQDWRTWHMDGEDA
jgi:toxin ParE1/3/4